jgi:hypothetical protein
MTATNGRGVSLAGAAGNGQERGYRRSHDSKTSTAKEEGAARFAICGVVDSWRMSGMRQHPLSALAK